MTTDFSSGSAVKNGKESICQCRRHEFDPWVRKIPWRRKWQPTPVLLPGKSHGWRSLVGYSTWGCEESDTTEWLHFHFSLSCIGEGNGNPLQCSCLENPRDREPGGLPSMGSHRVGHVQSWTQLNTFHSFQCVLVTQLCLTLCDPMELQPTRLLCAWNSPGKNTGVGCHFLLQGIFLTQGSNSGLPDCRHTL